jgi:hypothetical protein
MRQIFVFTAGREEARQHLVDSIENPVDDTVVFGNFDEAHHEELERIRDEAGGFYAWGAVWGIRNRPTWEQMERDDFVLCVYDGFYHYVARVLAKYDNPECAESIWGTNDEGQTWRYMYFLTEPIEIYQPLFEFEGYLNSTYRGFTRISQRVALVLTRPQVDEIRTCSVDFSMSPPNIPYAMWVNITETRCQTRGWRR